MCESQNRMLGQPQNVQNWTVSKTCLDLSYLNEKDTIDAKIVTRCALSYVRGSCGKALCAGFRCSSHRTTREPKGCRI
jgi:hypothetical protein